MRWLGALMLAVLLAGCGTSPKTHYYTLAPANTSGGDKIALSAPVTVSAVDLPPSLDRRSIVHPTGQNTVAISGDDQWAAPLGEMTRRVLSQDLAAHVPADKLVLPGAPAPPNTKRIVVSVVRFGAEADGRVVLTGSWSLVSGSDGKPLLSRPVDLDTAASSGGSAGQAAGMSQLLGQLASDIAATLSQTG